MMMHIGLFPFAVAWNLSTNRTALQNSRRIRALIKEPTPKASKTKPPTKGKKSLVRWVAETTSELLVDDNQLVNCSFRESATEIGIKSASVHHHFPAEQDLAVAVARRYAKNFRAGLGEPAPAGKQPEQQIALFCDVFRSAFASSGLACLCGVLSSESALLPERVQQEIAAFVDANVVWLEQALAGGSKKRNKAIHQNARLIYAALQGAMAVARLKQDSRWLDDVSLAISHQQ
jgi:TetR/AcrR family transcriptional regulator, transcriptional repressor for nem operon